MVCGVRLLRLVKNNPKPPLHVILLSSVVGLVLVPKTIPNSVICVPPSCDTLPPTSADWSVICVAAIVSTVAVEWVSGPHTGLMLHPPLRSIA